MLVLAELIQLTRINIALVEEFAHHIDRKRGRPLQLEGVFHLREVGADGLRVLVQVLGVHEEDRLEPEERQLEVGAGGADLDLRLDADLQQRGALTHVLGQLEGASAAAAEVRLLRGDEDARPRTPAREVRHRPRRNLLVRPEVDELEVGEVGLETRLDVRDPVGAVLVRRSVEVDGVPRVRDQKEADDEMRE